jgi:arylsulfatase A-like enzyme
VSVSGRNRAALLLVFASALGLSCGPEGPPVQSVVLIVVDTLRADHIGGYGYSRATTPRLDEWMSRARRYDRAMATSSWTLPSVASMLTGRLPAGHGAGEPTRRDGKRSFTSLEATIPTLPGFFRARGMATGAIVTNAALSPVFGLDRGFDSYDYVPATPLQIRRAGISVQRALAWIDAQDGRPFFLLIHLFDPHMNYDPPPGYRGRFSDPTTSELGYPVTDTNAIRAKVDRLSEEDRRFIAAAYDEEIAFVDHQLGVLRAGLEQRGILERGLVVLTSDHGEELFEHGSFEHGHAMWQEVLRLPLLFWGRGVKPGSEAAAVSLLDLPATLVEAAGFPVPEAFEGLSLWSNLTRGRPLPQRTLVAEGNLYGAQQTAAIRWPLKAVWTSAGEDARFWNLEADPGEHADGSSIDPDRAAELVEAVRARNAEDRAGRAASEPAELDPATRESLQSLGYVE